MMNDTRATDILNTVQGGVTVPLLRAAVAGFFISLPILVLTAAMAVNGYEFARRWWWACWLMAWTITQVIWWLYDERGRKRMQEAVIYAIEMQFGQDINGDGDIGAPAAEEVITVDNVSKNENGFIEGRRGAIPVDFERARVFAHNVIYRDRPITVREWSGEGKLFSQDEFEAFRGWLEHLHGVRPRSEKDPRVGYELTPEGRKILEAIIARGQR